MPVISQNQCEQLFMIKKLILDFALKLILDLYKYISFQAIRRDDQTLVAADRYKLFIILILDWPQISLLPSYHACFIFLWPTNIPRMYQLHESAETTLLFG